jgi:serpin B
MTDAFGGGDFSGIADIGLQIDEVYHKTFIDVNENGTEAAAATAVVVVTTTAVLNPPPPPVFRADHPFLFALRDTHTGSLLFLGRMADPGAATASAHVPEPATATLTIAGLMALATGRRRTRPRR